MNKNTAFLFVLVFSLVTVSFSFAQTPQPIKRFLALPEVRGASFSLLVKDLRLGETVYRFDPDRCLTPASVMKLVTTATALELLGEEFRFETTLEYDGRVKDGVLYGNVYIRGGGDPTLGSAFFAKDRLSFLPDENTFVPQWIDALTRAGIHTIDGRVISDERVFDNEGVSRKWLYEDLGSYYGMGCYGISVFDNQYKLVLRTGQAGSTPLIQRMVPAVGGLRFENYMIAANVLSDSSYIMGAPFSDLRFLYGVVPAGKESYVLKGDIPDPPLFFAEYMTERLLQAGFEIRGEPTCFRLLSEKGDLPTEKRTKLMTTYSPSLAEIARVTNEFSHNLYAEALLKTVGLLEVPDNESLVSSFDRGVNVLKNYWAKKGLDTSVLQLYDGSGLAVTDKLTTDFLCDLLIYMRKQSSEGDAFVRSIPRVGLEGSVRNFLKGSFLQGKARLKSGSMTGVKSYAGYIEKDGRTYVVAMMINNYAGEGRLVTQAMERLFLSLF
ncbi:MAG: D-alanyl-D-alanine carboxypeptidase/D-alanyl-D-alanine-endopeptidase [Massilibacteroides sp.]|nr:D-alanyl-D-alanine carboxypeptidase/D-alanyl-D-alanine-endopeptidase [Massilibacteroides sp.]